MTEPEDPSSWSPDREDVVEHEADLVGPPAADLPDEADEGDVVEQQLDVPDAGEDEYR